MSCSSMTCNGQFAEFESVIFLSGWWRLDSHDLGNRIQACGPGQAASLKRSWHQHQGQGWLRTLSSLFDIWFYGNITFYIIVASCCLLSRKRTSASTGQHSQGAWTSLSCSWMLIVICRLSTFTETLLFTLLLGRIVWIASRELLPPERTKLFNFSWTLRKT